MSLERRKALLDVAKEHDLLIVEDSAYNFMRYEGEARPPLKALDDEGRVIVVGTFSKIMGDGVQGRLAHSWERHRKEGSHGEVSHRLLRPPDDFPIHSP